MRSKEGVASCSKRVQRLFRISLASTTGANSGVIVLLSAKPGLVGR